MHQPHSRRAVWTIGFQGQKPDRHLALRVLKNVMHTRKPLPDLDLDAQAQVALEEARAMPPGPDKTKALRKAGELRNAADISGFLFARRGRPRKE